MSMRFVASSGPQGRPAPFLAALGVALLLSGCQAVTRRAGLDPAMQADRLMATYPDLQSGRFTVIADFEQARHMELFRGVSSASHALHKLSLTAGIRETGGRCLHAAFRRPDDQLVADSSLTAQWNLPRDWREYDLMIMNIHADAPGKLRLSLSSGHDQLHAAADSYIPLHPGWNLVRFDLADAGEHVALDDIREIRWCLPELAEPSVLLIDDVLLANNRVDLYGDSSADQGALYVRRRGRRWDLGAGGRFEVGLINGQIKTWYNLASDPLRVRNLVEGTILGPGVVSLDGEGDAIFALQGFPTRAERVIVRQRIVETSPARIVAAARWEFGSAAGTYSAAQPNLEWTYCLYPSGLLYVHVECSTDVPEWNVDNLGLAVSRRESESTKRVCHSTSQLGDMGRLLHVPYASAVDEYAALLFVVHDGRSAPLVRCLRSEANATVTAVAYGGLTRTPTHHWDCLLALNTDSQPGDAAAADRALHYCFPPALRPTVGTLVTDSEGDRDRDGFNERDGCYVVAPEANRVVLDLDGRDRPLYSPAFVIQGSTGKEAWVYLDYAIFEDMGRTEEGNVLFQLPTISGSQHTLEVHLRNPGA